MLQQKTFQAKQFGPHAFEPSGNLTPKWYIVDAADQVVGRLSTLLARVIMGKHKPTFTRNADAGDFVVVINADKVVFTRNKWRDKNYYDHSGYVSGLKTKSATEMLKRHPTEILRRAVWGMTTKSQLASRQMVKLKLYTGTDHPHQAQNPQPLPAGATRRTPMSKSAKPRKASK